MSDSTPTELKKAGAPLLALVKNIHEKVAEVRARSAPAPAAAIPCPHCRGRGYVLAAEGPVAVGRACSCAPPCGACHGRGIRVAVRDGYEFTERCECQTLGDRLAAYNAAQVPARFAGKGFDEFYVDEHDPKELLHALRGMREFADMARPDGARMLGKGLIGRPGCGKTHLLAATLTRLSLGRGVPCRYIEISFLFADLKAAISDPRARATVDKIDGLAEVPILAIDELGKGRGSVFEEEVLDELVGRRYNNGKLTLFASNYPRVEPRGAEANQTLRARVGERVFSRLHDMVEFIELPQRTRDRRGGGGAVPPRDR